MTEEELEDLQWQLGDFGPAGGYGSLGAKRRQEPADMSIEEMEAELEETKELIRKRRRGIRLLGSEQHSGVVLPPGARCLCQLRQGRGGGD